MLQRDDKGVPVSLDRGPSIAAPGLCFNTEGGATGADIEGTVKKLFQFKLPFILSPSPPSTSLPPFPSVAQILKFLSRAAAAADTASRYAEYFQCLGECVPWGVDFRVGHWMDETRVLELAHRASESALVTIGNHDNVMESQYFITERVTSEESLCIQ